MRSDKLAEIIGTNLVDYLTWSFLEAEGFTNVPVNTPGVDDQYAQEKLFPVHAQGVGDGSIWQAVNTDWVYETGMEVPSPPTIASGVYVNGTLYPTASTSGAYAHYINYPAGQVVFDSAIPLTSVVQAAYAWKWVSVYDNRIPWFQDVVLDAVLLDQQANTNNGSGTIALLDTYRVQPPLVLIEPVMRRGLTPYQLGSGAQDISQDVLLHIITEHAYERNNLLDILTFQQDHTIILYDVNARRTANDYTIDWRGMTNTGAKMYPALVTDFAWRKAYYL